MFKIFPFPDAKEVSRELSLHPIHLTRDKQGNLPPSALIPYCSYQGESTLLGKVIPEVDGFETCDRFEPTVLEGQLCFSIDVAKYREEPTKKGKAKGLFLMLDPNPYKPNTIKNVEISRTEDQTFRVYIHTLAQYSTFGPGSYGMSTLKKMTGTESFEELPDHQKKCLVHNREECQTQKYLDQVQRECKCIPWALQNSQYKYKVQ